MTEQQGEEVATRSHLPGTVAVVSMRGRRAEVALFDGNFWRSFDAYGPTLCAPAAITSIETPLLVDPSIRPEAGEQS